MSSPRLVLAVRVWTVERRDVCQLNALMLRQCRDLCRRMRWRVYCRVCWRMHCRMCWRIGRGMAWGIGRMVCISSGGVEVRRRISRVSWRCSPRRMGGLVMLTAHRLVGGWRGRHHRRHGRLRRRVCMLYMHVACGLHLFELCIARHLPPVQNKYNQQCHQYGPSDERCRALHSSTPSDRKSVV